MAARVAAPAFLDGPKYPDVSDFCQNVFDSFARSDQRRWGELYVRGLISVPGRKTIRRISELAGGRDPVQSLQQFVNQSPWSWGPVRHALAGELHTVLRPRAWVVQEVAFPKNGDRSVGVDRQYISSKGRTLNCQRAISVHLAGDEASAPVNWRLILPRSWNDAACRRAKAGLPDSERSQPFGQYVLDALDEMAGDWRLAPLPVIATVDDRGEVGPLVRGLEQRNLPYILDIPPSTPLATASPSGGGTAAGLVERRPERGRMFGAWGEGHAAGPTRSTYLMAPVPGGLGALRPDGLPSPGRRLIARQPTAAGGTDTIWLTSLGAAGISEPLGLLQSAQRSAANFAALSEKTGLLHFEGRSFRGWHHHVTLASIAYGYLVAGRARRPKECALRNIA